MGARPWPTDAAKRLWYEAPWRRCCRSLGNRVVGLPFVVRTASTLVCYNPREVNSLQCNPIMMDNSMPRRSFCLEGLQPID